MPRFYSTITYLVGARMHIFFFEFTGHQTMRRYILNMELNKITQDTNISVLVICEYFSNVEKRMGMDNQLEKGTDNKDD